MEYKKTCNVFEARTRNCRYRQTIVIFHTIVENYSNLEKNQCRGINFLNTAKNHTEAKNKC